MIRQNMQHAHEVARYHLAAAAKRQKEGYDVKLSFHTYKPGDYVWYSTEIGQLSTTPKLRVPFEGPFLVIRALTNLTYQIQLDRSGTTKVVHHNKLKPCQGNKVLKWAKGAVAKAGAEKLRVVVCCFRYLFTVRDLPICSSMILNLNFVTPAII